MDAEKEMYKKFITEILERISNLEHIRAIYFFVRALRE